jgi:hypothetical protein
MAAVRGLVTGRLEGNTSMPNLTVKVLSTVAPSAGKR